MCAILVEHTDLFSMSGLQELILISVRNYLKGFLPVFFMITGVLLLDTDKKITIKQCFCKYARRMMIALFLFGIPFAAILEFAETRTLSVSLLWSAFIAVLEGESFAHLWYLYALIGIYLTLPLFKVFCDNTSHQTQGYLLLVIFAFNFILPFIEKLTGIKIYFSIPIGSFPAFYLLLGRYMDDAGVNIPTGGLFAGLVIIFIASFPLTADAVPAFGNLFSYDSPVVMLIALLLFMLVKRGGVKEPPQKRDAIKKCSFIWKVDRLCFGAYLIHYLIIEALFRIVGITPLAFGSNWILACIVFLAAFTAISFVISLIMMQIPPLRKYVL